MASHRPARSSFQYACSRGSSTVADTNGRYEPSRLQVTCWSTWFHHFMKSHAADWLTAGLVLVIHQTPPPIWALPGPVTPGTSPAPKSSAVTSTGPASTPATSVSPPRKALIDVAEVEVSIVIEL